MTAEGEDGPWTYYYENGRIESVGNFALGEKTGSWKYFSRTGRLLETVDHTPQAAVEVDVTGG